MQVSQPLVPLVDEFAARLFGELDYVQVGVHSAEKNLKGDAMLGDGCVYLWLVSSTKKK